MEFLADEFPPAASQTTQLIPEAIGVLANHPLVGRSVESGLRELVISRGESGHLALYHYDQNEEVIVILAIRHQREAGYMGE